MKNIKALREGMTRIQRTPWNPDHLSRHMAPPRDQRWIDAEEAALAMNHLEALLAIAEVALCPSCGERRAGLCSNSFHQNLDHLA